MRTKLIILAAVVVAIATAIGLRCLQLLPYPKGDYNWVASPNERHRAYVYRLTDKGFFGGTREVYRLKVEYGRSAGGERLAVFEQDVPQSRAPGAVDMQRLEEIVEWTPDSLGVTYKMGGESIRVDVPL